MDIQSWMEEHFFASFGPNEKLNIPSLTFDKVMIHKKCDRLFSFDRLCARSLHSAMNLLTVSTPQLGQSLKN